MSPFAPIEDAVEVLAAGGMVVVVDDEDRENEGDLIMAAEKVTPEAVNFISKEARGLICVPMAPPMLDRAVKQCLAKDPDQRWQTAGDLKRALQWIAEGGSAAGVPVPVARRRRVRERGLWAVAAVLLVATLGLGWRQLQAAARPPEVVTSHLLAPDGNEYEIFAGGHFAISPDGQKLAFVAQDSAGGPPGSGYVGSRRSPRCRSLAPRRRASPSGRRTAGTSASSPRASSRRSWRAAGRRSRSARRPRRAGGAGTATT